MTTILNTGSATMESLIGAYRSHLLGRALPTPAVVTFYPDTAEIYVQPGSDLALCGRLGSVLVWAYTLAEVTAQWRHTTDGALHVTVTGRTTSGTRMTVYANSPIADCHGLVGLARQERETVTLDELYTLVGLLREAPHEPEAV